MRWTCLQFKVQGRQGSIATHKVQTPSREPIHPKPNQQPKNKHNNIQQYKYHQHNNNYPNDLNSPTSSQQPDFGSWR